MNDSLTYKDSGVDKEAGYKSVKLMKQHVERTFTKGVLSSIGGFSGLFELDKTKYKEPVLVSGTDGVGTKIMIAFKTDIHHTIGEDCVAMCVNDVLCQGAKPLFFLDYIATAKIQPEKIEAIVKGISNGCIKAEAALIGGETAEMPGLYAENDYDLAGFAVGVVDKHRIIEHSKVNAGDLIFALPSSGLHSNGFSLVRKIVFERTSFKLSDYVAEFGRTLGEELLEPTRIYVNPMFRLIEKYRITGISHITGGGFYENIPRMLPKNLYANISIKEIERKAIFDFLKFHGKIETREMYGTFNMGVGMVFSIDKNDANAMLEELKSLNEKVYFLGEVCKGENEIAIDFHTNILQAK